MRLLSSQQRKNKRQYATSNIRGRIRIFPSFFLNFCLQLVTSTASAITYVRNRSEKICPKRVKFNGRISEEKKLGWGAE